MTTQRPSLTAEQVRTVWADLDEQNKTAGSRVFKVVEVRPYSHPTEDWTGVMVIRHEATGWELRVAQPEQWETAKRLYGQEAAG